MEKTLLDSFRIVLVGTLYSGNIGSVCRAMANMGIRDLALVTPRICDDGSDAARMAVHADDILESKKTFETLDEAVADCSIVVGTTARGGLYRAHVQEPRELFPELIRDSSLGKIALVFGREDKGLTNDEIMRCNRLIRIPVNTTYTSINLSQAVLICCYELFLASGLYEPPVEMSQPVEHRARQRMMEIWREMLLKVGFMEEEKADHMMQGMQRIFSRGVRTADDAAILMGVARQVEWFAGKRK